MAEATFYPSPYGYIDDSGSTAFDLTGTASKCVTQDSNEGDIARGYFSFDTSSIPEVATVEDVSIRAYCDHLSVPVDCNISVLALMVWWEHDVIGEAITTGDWGFANFGAFQWWGLGQPSPPSLPYSADIDLPNESVNTAGDSDYEFIDASTWSISDEGPALGYYAKKPIANVRMWLTVTYSIPGGLFNRWNWRLPALPGFSSVLAAVLLPSGDLKVMARFYPRPLEA